MIQLTLYGHACIQIDTGVETVLCDPHLFGEFASDLFAIYPRREIDIDRIPAPDLIYLSHHHRDHFDLRSLSRFERDTPVLHPDSPEIVYGLEALGFCDRRLFRDWEIVELSSARLMFTPSRVRVPENGLLVYTDDEVAWNLVDTVPDLEVVARVRRRLGRRVDLLLWPYQPLLETTASQSAELGFPRHKFERAIDTLATINPRFAVPYADAQFGTASTAWLNHYRFPVEFTEIAGLVAGCAPNVEVVEMAPGQRLIADAGELRRGADADYIAATPSSSIERSFDSTAAAPSIAESDLGALARVDRGLADIVDAISVGWRLLSARFTSMLAVAADWQLSYDLICETVDGEVGIQLVPGDETPRLSSPPPADGDRNRVVVRTDLGVLEKILFGELHLVTAVIAGLVRSWHRAYRIRDGVVCELEWLDELGRSSASAGGQAAGAELLLNLLVAMSDEGLRCRYIDHEVEEARREAR
jgi:hypothetical protein